MASETVVYTLDLGPYDYDVVKREVLVRVEGEEQPVCIIDPRENNTVTVSGPLDAKAVVVVVDCDKDNEKKVPLEHELTLTNSVGFKPGSVITIIAVEEIPGAEDESNGGNDDPGSSESSIPVVEGEVDGEPETSGPGTDDSDDGSSDEEAGDGNDTSGAVDGDLSDSNGDLSDSSGDSVDVPADGPVEEDKAETDPESGEAEDETDPESGEVENGVSDVSEEPAEVVEDVDTGSADGSEDDVVEPVAKKPARKSRKKKT